MGSIDQTPCQGKETVSHSVQKSKVSSIPKHSTQVEAAFRSGLMLTPDPLPEDIPISCL